MACSQGILRLVTSLRVIGLSVPLLAAQLPVAAAGGGQERPPNPQEDEQSPSHPDAPADYVVRGGEHLSWDQTAAGSRGDGGPNLSAVR